MLFLFFSLLFSSLLVLFSKWVLAVHIIPVACCYRVRPVFAFLFVLSLSLLLISLYIPLPPPSGFIFGHLVLSGLVWSCWLGFNFSN